MKNSIRHNVTREVKTFLSALMFFTRIKSPVKFEYDASLMQGILKYFPLAGWITGVISGGVYFLANLAFSPGISALAALTASILATGAIHEDGFADVCDGFGGGWNKTKILHIMKDSAIGVFGTLGVLITFFLRYKLIEELNPIIVPISIIIANSFSRFTPLLVIRFSKYASDDEGKSKSTFLEAGINIRDLIIGFLLAIIPVFLLNNFTAWLILIPPVLAALYMNWYFKKWIGGYRGDCIGAVQQVSEILLYAGIVLLYTK
jgi:adenosylcobinamide-GDP ribazoletransferase